MDFWSDFSLPIIFAHRGASAYAPENTLAAFELAVQQGAQAIELDAKLSTDGHVIVIHDQSVDRTTDGVGKVAEMPLSAMRELDAGSSFSEKFRGERIPTLDEVFEAVGKRILINVELTNYATPFDVLVPKVVELVRRHALEKRVLFSSFFPNNLRRARRLLPEVPRGLLTWAGWMGAWSRTFSWLAPYQALHPYTTSVNARLVQRFHAAGRRVHVWTVNDEVEMRRLFALGVDGIFTDDPLLSLRTLNAEY
jgi:glycerophosphoryl diester phosphodiesterase